MVSRNLDQITESANRATSSISGAILPALALGGAFSILGGAAGGAGGNIGTVSASSGRLGDQMSALDRRIQDIREVMDEVFNEVLEEGLDVVDRAVDAFIKINEETDGGAAKLLIYGGAIAGVTTAAGLMLGPLGRAAAFILTIARNSPTAAAGLLAIAAARDAIVGDAAGANALQEFIRNSPIGGIFAPGEAISEFFFGDSGRQNRAERTNAAGDRISAGEAIFGDNAPRDQITDNDFGRALFRNFGLDQLFERPAFTPGQERFGRSLTVNIERIVGDPDQIVQTIRDAFRNGDLDDVVER